MSPWISSGKSSKVTHHQEAILLAAWRGKLSEEEWESRIRKVLPRGVNGDVYDLADCLLKQALVGPVPNQLFISYLKHAVKCKLVSHGAVLSSIAHQSTNIRPITTTNNPNNTITPHRTSSVICLLEFLKSFRDKIACKGTEIECLNLCHSLSQLIHWLLKCIMNSLDSVSGVVGGSQYPNQHQQQPQSFSINATPANNMSNMGTSQLASANPITNINQLESVAGIIDLCNETILYFISRPFTKSLLFISKLEYSKEFDDILDTVQVIQHKLATNSILQPIHDKMQHSKILQQLDYIFNSRDMHPSVVAAQQLRCLQMHRIRSTNITSNSNFAKNTTQNLLNTNDSSLNYALFNSLYPLVAFDAVLRPARSHKSLARQISVITDFNSAPMHMTYCELIRVCMIGLIDTDGTPAKVKWAFFTFLKLPRLLIVLSRSAAADTSNPSKDSNPIDFFAPNQVTNFINDLKLAFERLCEYSPLLDEAEYKCSCDFSKCLVKELVKNDPGLMQLRNVDFRKFPARRATAINNDKPGELMLKTEPVVTTVLEALNPTHKPMELYSVLCQVVRGKQFEYIISCAASTRRLQLFVKKLVENNERNRIASDDCQKNPQIQAYIFDITFLMLTYIAQQCGPEIIDSEQQTTFSKWFYECYHQKTRINCPKEMLKNSNDEIVSSLIKQLVHPESGIQIEKTNWRDVCSNIPRAISEILNAWNQGCLTDEDMQIITERIKAKMCFVAVVTATWLQCHIRTLNSGDRTKPLALLQNLTKPSQYFRQQKLQANAENDKQENYSERSSLMLSIIRKINFEVAPKIDTPNSTTNNTANTALSKDNENTIDESAYQSVNDRFISTLTTQEIFLVNVKQCLNRGWIDFKTLNSLNSLFKMIGSECFTNLIVEQILTSHESPSDLSRAVHITFGLFHLDIEACAFALLKDTIPSWLMGEKKQMLLNQPRAFALAHLTVMTIVEVFSNFKPDQPTTAFGNQDERKTLSAANGVSKMESDLTRPAILLDSVLENLGPKDAKRIKPSNDICDNKELSQDLSERLDRLNSCISDLMRLFKEIMSDSVMSQRTLFPVLFLQQAVVCTREGSSVITAHLQPEILLDIINLFSSELTFELVLAISNLSTTNSRKYAAKAMCQLAEVKESKQNQ